MADWRCSDHLIIPAFTT